MHYNIYMLRHSLPHIADVFAIPFFLLLFVYLWRLPEKSGVEYILLFFSVAGFLSDLLFTFMYYVL